MAQPKVSVVIPVYNTARYLKSCLDSIISQTLDDIEIICIDDGSTDVSLEILRDYEKLDNRIRVFTQQNGGAAVSRNRGMKIAVGEYLYFCDSDDYLLEDALSSLYHRAKTEGLDILGFSGCAFYESAELREQYCTYNGYYHREHTPCYTGPELFDHLQTNNRFRTGVPLQFFKRQFLIENALFFPEGLAYEDELFTPLAMLRAERAACISDVLYMRRIRLGSAMTTSPHHHHFDSQYIIYAKLLAEYICGDYAERSGGPGLLASVRGLHWSSMETYKALSQKERNLVMKSASPAIVQLFERDQIRLQSFVFYRMARTVAKPIRKIFHFIRP